jgi:hypothetical protein
MNSAAFWCFVYLWVLLYSGFGFTVNALPSDNDDWTPRGVENNGTVSILPASPWPSRGMEMRVVADEILSAAIQTRNRNSVTSPSTTLLLRSQKALFLATIMIHLYSYMVTFASFGVVTFQRMVSTIGIGTNLTLGKFTTGRSLTRINELACPLTFWTLRFTLDHRRPRNLKNVLFPRRFREALEASSASNFAKSTCYTER